MKKTKLTLPFMAFFLLLQLGGRGQKSAEELAKELSNPVASLISVPFQNNSDFGVTPSKGSRNTLNIQPVVPIGLSKDYNLILRWVQPIITQYNISGTKQNQGGLADAVISAFFSPKSTPSGIIWGAGPVILAPVATTDAFATHQLGLGPTVVVLKQSNGWTYGALVNQIWRVAGSTDNPAVNQMFVQPFLGFTWKSGAGATANMEWTQNWTSTYTTLWFNPIISGITSFGSQKISLAAGPRFNLIAPPGAKAEWGVRVVATLIFPK